jgi:anaerobic dimethyl sulfoxide reductase subunit B
MSEKQLGFYINLSACSGCKACQIACKDKNDTPVGVMWRKVYEVTGGEWLQRGDALIDNTFTYYVSSACNHCTKPVCMDVCPSQAISKREEDGVVLIDSDRCIGCRYCEWACPYGAPQYNEEEQVMTKCDFCFDYIDAGQKPACVSACQMRVLDFGEMEELRARYGSLDDIAPLPDPDYTEPNHVFTPHKDALRASTAGASIGNREEV